MNNFAKTADPVDKWQVVPELSPELSFWQKTGLSCQT